LHYLQSCLRMIIFGSSVANVTPTYLLLHLTNSLPGLLCVFIGYSTHHKGYRCLNLSSNRVIISRHVIFDETSFPFAERHGPSTSANMEFLDFSDDVVPAPIGHSHTLFPASLSPSTSDAPVVPAGPRVAELGTPPGVTSAPTGPSVTVPGAPEIAEDDVPVPALYVPPALRSPGPPSAPCAAMSSSSPAPRAAPEMGASPRHLYVPPALRAGASPSTTTTGSAPPPAPRGPPPGFPPLRPERLFVHHYSRRPRPLAAPAPATSAVPAATPPVTAAPLPKGAVPVHPVSNQHAMGSRSKSSFRMPAAYHTGSLSPVPKTFHSALADPNWRAAMEEEHRALLQNDTWDLVPRPPRANIVTSK